MEDFVCIYGVLTRQMTADHTTLVIGLSLYQLRRTGLWDQKRYDDTMLFRVYREAHCHTITANQQKHWSAEHREEAEIDAAMLKSVNPKLLMPIDTYIK